MSPCLVSIRTNVRRGGPTRRECSVIARAKDSHSRRSALRAVPSVRAPRSRRSSDREARLGYSSARAPPDGVSLDRGQKPPRPPWGRPAIAAYLAPGPFRQGGISPQNAARGAPTRLRGLAPLGPACFQVGASASVARGRLPAVRALDFPHAAFRGAAHPGFDDRGFPGRGHGARRIRPAAGKASAAAPGPTCGAHPRRDAGGDLCTARQIEGIPTKRRASSGLLLAAYAESGSDTADLLLERAQKAIEAKDYKAAEKILDGTIAFLPDCSKLGTRARGCAISPAIMTARWSTSPRRSSEIRGASAR